MDPWTRRRWSCQTGPDEVVLDLTHECRDYVAGRGDGLLHVFVPHATAGIAILETGAGSDDDLLAALGDLLPADDRWQHRHGSRGHGRSHVMPAIVPPYATVAGAGRTTRARHLAERVPGRPQHRQPGARGPPLLPAQRMKDAELGVAARRPATRSSARTTATPVERFAKSPTDFATAADLEAERGGARRPPRRAARRCGPGGGGRPVRPTRVRPHLVGRPTLRHPQLRGADPAHRRQRSAPRERGVVTAAASRPTRSPRRSSGLTATGLAAAVYGADTPLVPSATSALVDVNLDAVHPDPGRFRPADLLGHPDFRARYGGRVLSTTLALVWVAAGRRAAYVTDGRFADNVHFASGIAICRAAGCVVTDLRGEPVDSPGGSGLLVAADDETHRRLLELCANSNEEMGKRQV